MTKIEIKQEMAHLKETIYGMWIAGDRGRTETVEGKATRYRLTDRWYELRRQLRAS